MWQPYCYYASKDINLYRNLCTFTVICSNIKTFDIVEYITVDFNCDNVSARNEHLH